MNTKIQPFLICALALLPSLPAFAFDEVGIVITVIDSKQIAIVKLSSTFDKNSKSVFLGTNEKNCEASILKIDGEKASVKIDACQGVNLKVGGSVYVMEASLVSDTSTPTPSPSPSPSPSPNPTSGPLPIPSPSPFPEQTPTNQVKQNRNSFFLGLDYNMADDAKFSSVEVSGPGEAGSGNLDAKVDTAFSISVGFQSMPSERSWGVETALIFEEKRNLNSGNLTINGQNFVLTGGTTKDSIQITLLEINAIYRFQDLYIPMGLNIATATYTLASTTSGTNDNIDPYSGIGVQFGVGFILDEHIDVEFLARDIAIGISEVYGTTKIDWGIGHLDGGEIRFRYAF